MRGLFVHKSDLVVDAVEMDNMIVVEFSEEGTCGQGYYGAECQQECGHCHDSTQCVHTNGSCLTGCEVGYHGETCKAPCPYGFFGLDCGDRCKDTCDGCNRFDGSCDSGCNPGWQGNDCQDDEKNILVGGKLRDDIKVSHERADDHGGTTFKVIGEGFIAIYNLTVGFVDSEGKNLTRATELKDYLVFVGPGHCTITSLTETELVCRPPTKEPTTRLTEDKLFIRVKVGNIEQIVGIIEYIDQPPTLEYHSRRAPCAVNCHSHCVCCCNGTQTTSILLISTHPIQKADRVIYASAH
uniref:Scavenger receptor class F member 2 n=1 Tax=Magallana gigas TaxID=29159 RepID=K1RRM0_MAGGI